MKKNKPSASLVPARVYFKERSEWELYIKTASRFEAGVGCSMPVTVAAAATE